MGYHVSAYVRVGVKTTRDKLFTTVQTRDCEHAEQPGAKFCPQCGKKMFTEKKVAVPGFDEYAERYGDLYVESAVNCDSDVVIVGKDVGAVKADGPLYLDLTTLKKIEDDFKEAYAGSTLLGLGPVGVWVCKYESY